MAPPLPSYLTGDAPPPAAPPPSADLPPLPAYVTGDDTPQPSPAALAKAKGRPALGAYMAAQGAPSGLNPGMRQVKPPDAGFLTAAQAAATNAFGVPLAGAAETFRDWAAQHPTLAAAVAGPQAAQRSQAVPQGLTAELKAKAEQQRRDFLAAHPGTGGAAAEFATELGVNALPMVAGVPSAARSLAAGYSGVGGLANVATAGKGALAGASIGAPLGYASAYGAPTGERLSAAAQGGLFGAGLGAVGGMAGLERPPLPDYLTGGIAEAVPRTAAAQAHMAERFPGATMGERPLGSGAQLAGVPAAAAAPLGAPVQGHVQLDARYQQLGLSDETTGAMHQAVHQALDRAAPGRAALSEDGSVSVAADNEAHLHETLAAAQAHLAQHPLVATLPDGSQVHIPIEVTYGLSPEAAGPDALAGRVLAAPPPTALADGEAPGAGGGAPLAARPGELPQGYAVPHEGFAGAAPGEAAGAAEGPGGQAPAGGTALQAGGARAAGAHLAGGEAAQPAEGAAAAAHPDSAGRQTDAAPPGAAVGDAAAIKAAHAAAVDALPPPGHGYDQSIERAISKSGYFEWLHNKADEDALRRIEKKADATGVWSLPPDEQVAALERLHDQERARNPNFKLDAYAQHRVQANGWRDGLLDPAAQRSGAGTGMLYLNPKTPPSEVPVLDSLTRRAEGAIGDAIQSRDMVRWGAPYQANGGDLDTNIAAHRVGSRSDFVTPRGDSMPEAAAHYLAFYRHEMSPAYLDALDKALPPERPLSPLEQRFYKPPLEQQPPPMKRIGGGTAEPPGAAPAAGASPAGMAAELRSGEAGFAANPFSPSAAERNWRQFYPLRRSFVNQENADRLAAQYHETDLMKQFPDPELRKQMTLAVERNDPMQPAAEQFVRDHPQGGQAALDEIERQRAQGHLNFKGLQDLGVQVWSKKEGWHHQSFMPADVKEVPDYIHHEWQPVPGAPPRAEATPQPTENPITSVLQQREFPTLGTGIRAGRTPATLDYATVVRRGDESFSHTLALHRLMQDVSEVRTMSDGMPAYLRTKSRDPADLALLGKMGYQDMSGVPLMQRAIPGEGALYAHKNLYDNVAPLIRRTQTSAWGRAYDTVTGMAKQMLLGFSLFHPAELTIQNALQRGVTPALWEGLKRGFGAPGLNQLTQRMGWGNLERETWMQAAREGVNFPSPETDTNMLQIQKTLNSLALRAGLMDTRAGAAVVRTLGNIAASPHEAMFPGYMAPLKVMVQTINRDKLMRLRNGEDMAMGLGGWLQRGRIRALSDDEAIAGVTNATNNAFGGQSRALFRARFMNDPEAQKWFSRGFLAPDWFTSGAKLMGEPLSPNPVTRALGINMYLRLAWQTAVGLNLANYALTRAFSPTGRGHFMIDNEPGKETQLQTGPNEFMNVMKLQRELPDVIGKERVSNLIGAVAHAGPQGQLLEWLRQPHGPWPGADEPVATSHFQLTDPGWRETPVLSTIGNKVNPLPNAVLGELSGHYASGYPTDLTKDQEASERRGTGELKRGELVDRTQTALRPFMPIPGSKLMDTQEPLTAGNTAKQLLVPFQLSKGLSSYTAIPQLADAYRRGDQDTIDRVTAILMSHIDRRDPDQAAMGELKVQKILNYARSQASRYPQPLTASGKAEAAAQ